MRSDWERPPSIGGAFKDSAAPTGDNMFSSGTGQKVVQTNNEVKPESSSLQQQQPPPERGL
jgi:hypothetical protein